MNTSNPIRNHCLTLFATFILVISNIAIAAEEAVGVVISASGEVAAQRSETDIRTLTRGDDFYVKDLISTGSGATTSLRFIDGSVVELMGMTDYIVNDYHYAEQDPDKDAFSSELLKGGLRAISGKIGERNPKSMSVDTQMTTLTVRGTKLEVVNPRASPSAYGGEYQPRPQPVYDPEGGFSDLRSPVVYIQVNEGAVFVTNLMTGETVTMSADDLKRAVQVEMGGVVLLDELTPEMIAGAIGETNYVPPGQHERWESEHDYESTKLEGSGGGGGSDCETAGAAWGSVSN